MKGFITGGNRGIGLEFAKQLSEKDWDIYVGCREPEKANKLKKIIPLDNIILLDVKLEDSIQSAVQVLKTKIERLDLIINNAGIIGNRAGLNKVEIDDHLETFMTNTIGPLFITKYCLPLLGKDSTVVNISSLMGSIDDTSGGSYSYRISKAALNMLTKNLQEDLKLSFLLKYPHPYVCNCHHKKVLLLKRVYHQ